jgi:hypothetical protein
MRKIFNELPPTPKPCLKEKEAWDKAWKAWNDNEEKLESLKLAISTAEANLLKITEMRAKIKNEISTHEIIMKNTELDFLNNEKLLEETSILYSPVFYWHLYFQFKILYSKKVAEVKLLKKYKNKIEWCDQVEGYTIQTKKEKEKEQAPYKAAEWSLLKDKDTTWITYNSCVRSNMPLRFNLKPSCKEIKQNIKIVNQKLISLDNKLINLNHGILSLNVLNINKNLFDENIKIIKELIVELDKLKSINSKKLNNITPNSSFDVIYKKAQNDLSSYQEERKTFTSKIKTLEEKTKNIPEKKKRLKAQISNLFKEFKICSKNIPT